MAWTVGTASAVALVAVMDGSSAGGQAIPYLGPTSSPTAMTPAPTLSPTASPSPTPTPTPTQAPVDREPTFLTLRYDPATGVFKGAATSARKRCTTFRLVRLKKAVPGPNRVVGRDRTDGSGRWRIAKLRANGRFYATVAPKDFVTFDGTTVVCLRDRSVTIEIERN